MMTLTDPKRTNNCRSYKGLLWYLITTESKDVLLEPGKAVQVKFDNRLRPSLSIVIRDAQTGKPLAGAVSHVRKTESASVSEYVTDSNPKLMMQVPPTLPKTGY